MAIADLISFRSLLGTSVVPGFGFLVKFLVALYQHRQKLHGLPAPPYNRVLGHLPIMAKLMGTLPTNCHPHLLVHYLKEQYDLPDIFYIDTWPFGEQICAVVDPQAAYDVTVKHSLPKHPIIEDSIAPITGHNPLVSLNGKEHKKWRGIFNPGFSSAHLMTLLGGIVDDCAVFTDILAKHAKAQDIFLLEEAATRVTVDIIGRVVLDVPMNAQTTENDFVSAFRNQLNWLPNLSEANPFKLLNPFRPLIVKYNERRMNRFLMKVMNDRFASRSADASTEKRKRSRPVIDLALDTYLEEGGRTTDNKVDEALFQKSAMDHIKVFMFAGHDTTSSTICYVAYALSKHPECSAKFRQECNEVFGSDTSQTAAKIKADPHIINRLPYTVAIVKEALRLWPAASSVRMGQPGFFLHFEGKQYPTEGFMTWPVAHALQRSPKFWPRHLDFLPERWLAPPDSPLAPVKGAWRAFEYGPRNCIGQELAMIETKIIMALMLRDFRIETAYDEIDAKNGVKGVRTTLEGERAYRVLIATAKPADGMPCRVKRG